MTFQRVPAGWTSAVGPREPLGSLRFRYPERGSRSGSKMTTVSRMAPPSDSERQGPSAGWIVGNPRPGIGFAGVDMSQDDLEIWFEKGVSDGLPVIPPTRERVERMLAGTRRERDELLGAMPPNYGRLTVEKAAINAVLAGCRPDYLPVVIAAAECACDPALDRKSTRLNSSLRTISYVVFCLK